MRRLRLRNLDPFPCFTLFKVTSLKWFSVFARFLSGVDYCANSLCFHVPRWFPVDFDYILRIVVEFDRSGGREFFNTD